ASLDRRSDLYSVGAVLFECVGGRKMWQGTEMEVLRHLALDEPPALESVRPDAPAQLRALCMQLVAKNPGDRPASALDVARELRAFAAAQGCAGGAEIRALMQRLFAQQESNRKTKLEKALTMAAPAEAGELADELRASLAPERTSQSDLAASVRAHTKQDRPRSLAIVALAVLLAMGATALFAMRSEESPPAAASTSTVDPRPSTVDPRPSTVDPRPSTVDPRPSTSPPSSTTPHASGKSRGDKPVVKPPPHLDVDPNPI
ncbi:MAG: hypothetical protein ACREJX_17970, partial [Polyangiaceae bacterium]